MLFDNRSVISGYRNIDLDFKEHLSIKDSLIFKNCNNLKIRVGSKINKIIFINCYQVVLTCSSTIAGIDIEKCNFFKLIPIYPYNLNVIDCFKTNLDLVINNDFSFDNIKLINQDSKINLISI